MAEPNTDIDTVLYSPRDIHLIKDTNVFMENQAAINFWGDFNIDGVPFSSLPFDNSITQAKMADNSVGTTELIDNAVTQAKLADNSVGTAELIDLNVTEAKLGALSVSTNKVADNAISNRCLTDNAVSTLEIVDTSVTLAKLNADVIEVGTPIAGTGQTLTFVDLFKISRNGLSVCFLTFQTTNGSGSALNVGDTILTLPVGFRPPSNVVVLGINQSPASAVLGVIETNGIFRIGSAFDGIILNTHIATFNGSWINV